MKVIQTISFFFSFLFLLTTLTAQNSLPQSAIQPHMPPFPPLRMIGCITADTVRETCVCIIIYAASSTSQAHHAPITPATPETCARPAAEAPASSSFAQPASHRNPSHCRVSWLVLEYRPLLLTNEALCAPSQFPIPPPPLIQPCVRFPLSVPSTFAAPPVWSSVHATDCCWTGSNLGGE
jgi:hypothetical protein